MKKVIALLALPVPIEHFSAIGQAIDAFVKDEWPGAQARFGEVQTVHGPFLEVYVNVDVPVRAVTTRTKD